MKRITYAGTPLVTGDTVAEALLRHITQLPPDSSSVSVEIPVLEEDGSTAVHTLLVGPTTAIEMTDAEPLASGDESERFPAPEFEIAPDIIAPVASSDAERTSLEFDEAVAHVEKLLDGEIEE